MSNLVKASSYKICDKLKSIHSTVRLHFSKMHPTTSKVINVLHQISQLLVVWPVHISAINQRKYFKTAIYTMLVLSCHVSMYAVTMYCRFVSFSIVLYGNYVTEVIDTTVFSSLCLSNIYATLNYCFFASNSNPFVKSFAETESHVSLTVVQSVGYCLLAIGVNVYIVAFAIQDVFVLLEVDKVSLLFTICYQSVYILIYGVWLSLLQVCYYSMSFNNYISRLNRDLAMPIGCNFPWTDKNFRFLNWKDAVLLPRLAAEEAKRISALRSDFTRYCNMCKGFSILFGWKILTIFEYNFMFSIFTAHSGLMVTVDGVQSLYFLEMINVCVIGIPSVVST